MPARTFHSIGWWLLREERLARRGGPRELSFNQWRRLCAIALRDEGEWVDPSDARAAISTIKLGELASPEEFRDRADRSRDGPALARIYELYERHLVEQQIHDFDDLVLLAVRALRSDPELRRRWQARFDRVLVDEYQDIEPAQELLVRVLAAPQDCLFCVGDEDRPCTDGDAPAAGGWLTSISPIQGCNATRSRTTTAARGGSSPRRGG